MYELYKLKIMPVEIREIVIKTAIVDQVKKSSITEIHEKLDKLRPKILEDCKKMIKKEIRDKHSR